MDDMLGGLEEILKNLENNLNRPKRKKSIKHWKACAILLENGWKCVKTDSDPDTKNAIILTWAKEDKQHRIKLSFIEQQLWLNYLTAKEKKDV